MSSHNLTASPTYSKTFLKIRPSKLVYHPPFMGVITNEIKLSNISEEHTLAFKVKTTAPIRYCVRPNTGIIPPGKSIDVQILLNCTKDTPSISMKTKDKFQIQSIIVTDPNIDPKSIWQNSPPSQIMKHKLKAVFQLPNEQTSPSSSPIPSEFKSNSTIFSEVQKHQIDLDVPSITVKDNSTTNSNSNLTTTNKDNKNKIDDNKETNNIDNNNKEDSNIKNNTVDNDTITNNNNNNKNDSINKNDSNNIVKPQIQKRTNASSSNLSPSSPSTENEQLRSQVKNLNDQIETIKRTDPSPFKSQTIIIMIVIALLSFFIGLKINQ